MNVIRTRLHIAPDGTISGHVPETVPPGEHTAEIMLQPLPDTVNQTQARALIRSLQDELARLPVLDPDAPDEILGYDETGLFR